MGHFGRAKTGLLVRRLAFWVGQDVEVAEYVRSCQTVNVPTYQGGALRPTGASPPGDPLSLASLRGGMIGLDWIAGLPTTAAGFDMIQNHVDLLSGKVHAVPTRATATAADAAAIIRNMCLRSGDGFPDVLVVDHDSKFTSAFPSSRARCSAPSPRAWARASSSARRTTRTPTPRWNGPTALSVTR
jgi:hypothetical protein